MVDRRNGSLLLSFSGGKDSVLAAARLSAMGWEIRALLTALLAEDRTLVMHRVPGDLIALQAASLGLRLATFTVAHGAPNDVYEAELAKALAPFYSEGVRHVAFGDLFLTDIKAYRDGLMARLGYAPVYPLWDADTRALAESFLREGYRAVAVCVDASRLDKAWAGRELDAAFFADLPAGVDPCGENGEFHSFVYDGPGFRYPVRFQRSAATTIGGYHYCSLGPLTSERCARCGIAFECGVAAGLARCWCATMPAVAVDRARPSCLCPRCLTEQAAESDAPR